MTSGCPPENFKQRMDGSEVKLLVKNLKNMTRFDILRLSFQKGSMLSL